MSNKTKHTSGPWTIDSWRNGFTDKIAIQGPGISGDTVPVCWIGANRIASENEANAHLIVAAPNLLDVLENCALPLVQLLAAKMNNPKQTADAVEAIFAVIAKAKGEVTS